MQGAASLRARRKIRLPPVQVFAVVEKSAGAGAPPPSSSSPLPAPTPSATTPPASLGSPERAPPPGADAGSDLYSRDGHAPTFHDEYALGRTIGSGTFSTVRLATRLADGQPVAVKCVHSCDEEQIRATVSEYELMRTLEHPAVVHARDLHRGHNVLWLVMDLSQGGNVEQYMRKHGVFDEQQASAFSLQLLGALDYLHGELVVHRDVKPANILMSEDGAALKLVDFNSAMTIRDAATAEGALTFRGTRTYCAPELIVGGLWNDRVDVWACGLCVYFMLRARLPFDAGSRCALGHFLAGELPEVCWGGVPRRMRSVVLRCLVVDMRRRPAAAAILSQLPVPAQG